MKNEVKRLTGKSENFLDGYYSTDSYIMDLKNKARMVLLNFNPSSWKAEGRISEASLFYTASSRPSQATK